MFPNTARDEFHRRPYKFDAGRDPAIDEELLARERLPVIQDKEVAAPEEVAGMTGRPDPFRLRTHDEKISLSLLGSEPRDTDISFL